MKKKILILTLILAAAFIMPSLALPNFETGNETEEGEKTDFFDWTSINEFFNPPDEDKNNANPDNIIADLNKTGAAGFDLIRGYLGSTGDTYAFIDVAGIAKSLLKVFLPLGYMVFLISWCIGVGTKAITLELFETKDLIKVGVKLLAGIIFIGMSSEILVLISQLSSSVAESVLVTGSFDIQALAEPITAFDKIVSNIPIIGYFYRIYTYTLGNVPIMILNLGLVIVSWLISISLGIRLIKIALFQGVAPVFFGFMGSDDTKNYFQNFIVQYALICFKLVFTCVIFNAFQISFMKWVNSTRGFSMGITTGFVMMIVFTIMILKSDTIFEKMLHRG